MRAVAAAWATGGLVASASVLGAWCAGAPAAVGMVAGCVLGTVAFVGAALLLDAGARR